MSVRQGNKVIAGHINYHPDLFDHKWADHMLNDVSWLRADTFSWQDGGVYSAAYDHLADDIDGKSTQTETVGGITITFYLADDGHKICPASEESNVVSIYNATGVAWYYIIDTTNQRFKLPRTKFGFTGIRTGVGNYVKESLPNITDYLDNVLYSPSGPSAGGARRISWSSSFAIKNDGTNEYVAGSAFDASTQSSTYQNGAPVQQRSTEMYLYFYVGNFTQTALENTAGITAETLNDKVDVGHEVIEFQEPTALNNYTWYRKYADGWVEQGGTLATDASSITFPIEMADTSYTWFSNNAPDSASNFRKPAATKSTTGLTGLSEIYGTSSSHASRNTWASGSFWQVSGIAA